MKPSLKSLLRLLSRLRLDAVVIISRANKLYFSGYEYDEGFLLIDTAGLKLFVDPRFSIYAQQRVKAAEVIEARQPVVELNRSLKRYHTIGIDGSALLHRDFMLITSKLDRQKFRFIEQELFKIRAVKSAEEVGYIKTAARASGKALNLLINTITPDMTEKQVAAMLNLELINAGADDISFDTIVAFDERAAYAHAIPSNAIKLRGKRLMLCDFGAVYKGYHTDETHTFFAGSWSDDARKLYNAVLEAHTRAIDAAKAGMRASKLDSVAREFLDKKGYGKYFGHALGHGVGLDVHESPSINHRSKDILKNGMVFTIEPGVYIPDWGGIRIESMLYLSDRGKEVLTRRNNPVINLEA